MDVIDISAAQIGAYSLPFPIDWYNRLYPRATGKDYKSLFLNIWPFKLYERFTPSKLEILTNVQMNANSAILEFTLSIFGCINSIELRRNYGAL